MDLSDRALVASSLRSALASEPREVRHAECLGPRMMARSLPLCIFLSVASLFACGSGGDSGTGASDPKVCVAHLNPTPAQLATPPASFETQVAPILAQSCAFSSCHGSHTAIGNHGLFLGATSSDGIAAVKAALAGSSKAMPSMRYVTPGDLDKSFLLHKLDGDLCVIDDQCVGGSCGRAMPDGNAALPEASRDAIRRWVAQGAK